MRWNLAVAALAASFGFVSIIVSKVELSAEVLVLYRCALAVIVIVAALAATRRLALLRDARTRRYALALGATLGVHWFLFFETIKLSSVVLAVLAAYMAPILVAILAPRLLPERRSIVAFAALPPALAGLALVAFGGGADVRARPLALLTGLGTALTYAALIIGTKHVSSRVSAAALTCWNYAISGLVVVPLVLFGGRVLPEAGEVPYVVALGVVFTAVSGYLYIWLIRKVTAQAMGVLAYVEPVSAALLAWAFVGEALTWQAALGAALVIAGGVAVVLYEPVEVAPVEAPLGSARDAAA